jgi:TM2 domain-containing membrane protein YozV
MTTPLAGRAEQPPPLPAPGAYPTGPRLPKNPWLALALSLFPGVGQIYNGQPAKGIVFFFAWVSCIYGSAEISPFPFAFLIPFVYCYNLIDAWRSATAINNRFLGGQALPEEETTESPAWGGALVALGLLILFNNLGWFRLAALQRWWPLLMIVAGAVFVYGSMRRRQTATLQNRPSEIDERHSR